MVFHRRGMPLRLVLLRSDENAGEADLRIPDDLFAVMT